MFTFFNVLTHKLFSVSVMTILRPLIQNLFRATKAKRLFKIKSLVFIPTKRGIMPKRKICLDFKMTEHNLALLFLILA